MADGYRAIVIGGGVAGASIAYHLTELGWQDVLLVDRGELTSGSTFHSAGLVGQLRSSVSLTRMMMYGADLYRRLAAETGVDPGWHEVGSLRLASTDERMQELRRQEGWAHTFGLPLDVISTDDALARFPLFDPSGVQGAAFIPTDGHLDPTNLTLALAEGARRRGAEIRTNTRVTGIDVVGGRVRGVRTDEHGPIAADVVVNAGGMYANQIGRLAGVEVPVVPFAHQYLLTKPVPGGSVDLPTMRDPDRLVYFRGEAGGGLVMGGYERNPATWAVDDGPPADFNHQLLPDDWERFESLAENAFGLVPVLQTAEVVTMINGPEAFTPDGEFILGESEVRGFFVAAGFCAHGIAGAGGVGKVMADWIVHGEPEYDVWKMDIRRFGSHYRSRHYARERAYEVYATYYDIHYPGEERQAGRPLKTAPTYARLAKLGAAFGEKSGWERANWFATNEDPAFEGLRPRGWAGEHWSSAIAAEHTATRERAALFDESSFAKIDVSGPGAMAFLQRLAANDVDRAPGHRDLHPDAERAWRHRMRPDRHPDRRRPLRARDRDGVRQPRHRLDPQAARQRTGRGGDGPRRDRLHGLLRPVGSARSRHPVERDLRRPLERGVPVHDRAADRRGRCAVPRPAGDLRRRARVGAVSERGVRRSALGHARHRRRAVRDVARRLPRDRFAAPGEGLPSVGRGYHPRGAPVRGRAGVRGQDGRAGIHRERSARAGAGARA